MVGYLTFDLFGMWLNTCLEELSNIKAGNKETIKFIGISGSHDMHDCVEPSTGTFSAMLSHSSNTPVCTLRLRIGIEPCEHNFFLA
jgi:hypothetical protein